VTPLGAAGLDFSTFRTACVGEYATRLIA
jgi:hypothetical protein